MIGRPTFSLPQEGRAEMNLATSSNEVRWVTDVGIN